MEGLLAMECDGEPGEAREGGAGAHPGTRGVAGDRAPLGTPAAPAPPGCNPCAASVRTPQQPSVSTTASAPFAFSAACGDPLCTPGQCASRPEASSRAEGVGVGGNSPSGYTDASLNPVDNPTTPSGYTDASLGATTPSGYTDASLAAAPGPFLPPRPSDAQLQAGLLTLRRTGSAGRKAPHSVASPPPALANPGETLDLENEAAILADIANRLVEEDQEAEEEEEEKSWDFTRRGEEVGREEEGDVPLGARGGDDALAFKQAPSNAPDHEWAAFLELALPAWGGGGLADAAETCAPVKEAAIGTLVDSYAGFRCKCGNKDRRSCIDALNKIQLRQAYCSINMAAGAPAGPAAQRAALHRAIWWMKEPLARPNCWGHNYKVAKWSYDGVPLCRAGWMKITGCAYQAHRDMYSLVLRGISPTEVACGNGTELLLATNRQVQGQATEKQAFATSWLTKFYLNTMEYMPNENRIVLRGVGLQVVHSKNYSKAAKLASLYLSYKPFAACLHAAAVACALESAPDPATAQAVKVGRSARHSKFPMCTTCMNTRRDYIEMASDPLADKAELEKKLKLMMDHQAQFMDDRHAARALRMGSFHCMATDCYECDDKCGSHWCKAPVTLGGRDSKELSTRNYEFAIQANVVCGPHGVIRAAIVPKNVQTGANFGLSTLILGLHSAWRLRGTPMTATRLLRHTDGGPDNVAKLTHIFHWLLVYLGCWQDLVWFMFDAGHSHTEIADRLFALMKKLFETDNAASVEGGIESFEQLEDKLKATFHRCPEMKEIVYHFANWEMDVWLKGAIGFRSGDLEMITTNKVYRYEYVGDAPCTNPTTGKPSNMAAEHGGVRVTYKEHLSDTKRHANDDEWAPVRLVEELNAGGESMKANRTTKEGVLFVATPPDLSSEPARESLPAKWVLAMQQPPPPPPPSRAHALHPGPPVEGLRL